MELSLAGFRRRSGGDVVVLAYTTRWYSLYFLVGKPIGTLQHQELQLNAARGKQRADGRIWSLSGIEMYSGRALA